MIHADIIVSDAETACKNYVQNQKIGITWLCQGLNYYSTAILIVQSSIAISTTWNAGYYRFCLFSSFPSPYPRNSMAGYFGSNKFWTNTAAPKKYPNCYLSYRSIPLTSEITHSSQTMRPAIKTDHDRPSL